MTQDRDRSAGSQAPTRRRRRRRRALLAALAALATAAGLDAATLHRAFWFGGNFAVVEPGRAYRMGQPSADDLRRLRAELGVASVLNLRGGSVGDRFYRDEARLTDELHIDFYDFPMLAGRRPSRAELLALLDLFGRCRYPLLIHCKSGSDRTGLACGLYRMARLGEPPEVARRAFSLDRGHVPLFGPERLQEPFDEYLAWLRRRRLTHSPDRLRDWLLREYRDDGPPRVAARPLRPGPRPVGGPR